MKQPGAWLGAVALIASAAALACSGEQSDPTQPSTATQPEMSVQCIPACVFSTSISNPANVTVPPNTNHSTVFSIANTGNVAGTTALSCAAHSAGHFTCGSISPANLTLGPGGDGEVTVSWSANACCITNGNLILKDSHGGGSGTQRISVQ